MIKLFPRNKNFKKLKIMTLKIKNLQKNSKININIQINNKTLQVFAALLLNFKEIKWIIKINLAYNWIIKFPHPVIIFSFQQKTKIKSNKKNIILNQIFLKIIKRKILIRKYSVKIINNN